MAMNIGALQPVRGTAGCHSATVVTPKNEGKLHIPWDDGNTLCRLQQVMWNALIRRIHNLLEDLGSLAGSGGIVLAVGRDRDLSRKQNKC
jgi:hypothetical protein